MGHSKSSPKRKVNSDTGTSQERNKQKISYNLIYHLKGLDKEQKAQNQQKEGNNKDQRENKIEIKK